MQINTALLPLLPLRWNGRIDICLMYDLGDQLRAILDQVAPRRGDLCSVNRICGASLEEQGDQGAEGIQEEADDDQVDDEEDDRSAAHRE